MKLITDITARFLLITIIYVLIFHFIYPQSSLTLLILIIFSVVLFISVIFDLWRFKVAKAEANGL